MMYGVKYFTLRAYLTLPYLTLHYACDGEIDPSSLVQILYTSDMVTYLSAFLFSGGGYKFSSYRTLLYFRYFIGQDIYFKGSNFA